MNPSACYKDCRLRRFSATAYYGVRCTYSVHSLLLGTNTFNRIRCDPNRKDQADLIRFALHGQGEFINHSTHKTYYILMRLIYNVE